MTEITSEKRREIITVIRTRNKIPAIKLYREATGCSLKQAKETVESIAEKMNLESKGTGLQCSGCRDIASNDTHRLVTAIHVMTFEFSTAIC